MRQVSAGAPPLSAVSARAKLPTGLGRVGCTVRSPTEKFSCVTSTAVAASVASADQQLSCTRRTSNRYERRPGRMTASGGIWAARKEDADVSETEPTEGELLHHPDVRAAIEEAEQRASMSLKEQWAGELTTSLLEADRWLARDLRGVQGGHDLDVVLDDGSRIAVEVTTHTAGNRAAFYAELDRSNPIPAPSLGLGWIVDIEVPESEAADAKSIRPLFARLSSKLPPILERVEREDLHDKVKIIRRVASGPGEHEVCAQLRSLRVRHARGADWQRAGKIFLHQAGDMISFSADNLADAIEHEIPPNRDKLLKAKSDGAKEAHLFVWLPGGTSLNDGAHAAVRNHWQDRPPRHIDLQGLDSVWAAADSLPATHRELHGYSWPIWQFKHGRWHRWDRIWQRTSL